MVPDPAEVEVDVSGDVSLFEGRSGALRRPSFAMRFLGMRSKCGVPDCGEYVR